jgi:hypothetical protein
LTSSPAGGTETTADTAVLAPSITDSEIHSQFVVCVARPTGTVAEKFSMNDEIAENAGDFSPFATV